MLTAAIAISHGVASKKFLSGIMKTLFLGSLVALLNGNKLF